MQALDINKVKAKRNRSDRYDVYYHNRGDEEYMPSLTIVEMARAVERLTSDDEFWRSGKPLELQRSVGQILRRVHDTHYAEIIPTMGLAKPEPAYATAWIGVVKCQSTHN